jgi:adenine-specific DNA-methyltransferase
VRIEYPGKVSEAELWDSVAAARPKTKWKVEFGGAGGGAPEGRLLYGDNLPILKHLVENRSAVGKAKVVYIDPPFATGRAFATRDGMVAYHDLLKGGEFLEFLRKRLIFLREMLADDGSIYVHIDSTIGHYVKVVMDEVFGPECFRNDITRIKCNPKNFARNAYGSIGCRSPPRKSKNNSRRRTRRAGGTRRPRSTRRARPGTARPGKTGRG